MIMTMIMIVTVIMTMIITMVVHIYIYMSLYVYYIYIYVRPQLQRILVARRLISIVLAPAVVRIFCLPGLVELLRRFEAASMLTLNEEYENYR